MIKFDLQKKLDRIDGKTVLHAQMEIQKGDIVAIYGVSGVGKTTLLRLLAGLTKADAGHIFVENQCWLNSSKKIDLPPQQRKVGFVFQDYALFPNMTVLENLNFANPSKTLIEELLQITELEPLKNKKPHQLSGGQQQRVALARALVMQPPILLLDEPLSALDNDLRREMQDLILRLHQRFQMTTLLVSHDIPEIIHLANKILVLEYDKSFVYEQPLAYFQQKKAVQELCLNAEVLAVEGNVLTLRIGDEINIVNLSEKELMGITVGDIIHLKTTAIQTIIKRNFT